MNTLLKLYTGQIPLFSTIVNIAGTVLTLLLLLYVVVLKIDLATTESQLTATKGKLTLTEGKLENCESATNVLKSQLSFQNSQVQLLASNGTAIEDAINRMQEAHRSNYQAMMKAIDKKQYVSPKGCEASSDWMRERVGEFNNTWRSK